MTSKQEMQLIAPLAAGAGFFLMMCIVTARTGELNRYTAKGLLACSGLLSYALYLTLWQDEIKALWYLSPLLVVSGVLLSLTIPAGLFTWTWHVQTVARAQSNVAAFNGSERTAPVQALTRRVLFVWGLVNLVGLAAMLAHLLFFRSR